MRTLSVLIILCFSMTAFAQTRVKENIKQQTYTEAEKEPVPSEESEDSKKPEPPKKPDNSNKGKK